MINAYRIGVHLSMTQNVSAALGLITSHMLGLQRHINMAQVGFNRLGTAIAGAGAAFAGAGLIRGVMALTKAGEELVHQQTLLRMAGEDNVAVAKATEAAWATAFKVQGTTAAQNLRVLGDLRGLFGSIQEAEQVLPRFAQFQRVLSAVTGQGDEKAGGVMAQALDLMGAVRFDKGQLEQGRLDAYMNQAIAAIINNRGRVGPEQIRNFVQQAGPAANVMSPQQLFADMSVLIESMGGMRAGTGIAALQRQFLNGIMTDRTYDTLRMIGMTTGPKGKISAKERAAAAAAMQREMEGGARIDPASLVKVAPKGIRGSDRLARGDYAGFVLQELVPQIEKFLKQSGQEVNQQNILGLLSRVGSTGPNQRTAAQIFLSQQQIERERSMQAKIAANPQEAIAELQRTDPTAAMQRLSSAWENLMTAIGAPAVPMKVRLLNMLASGIDKFTAIIAAHPNAAKILVGVAAGLGVALVAIGGLALAAAAIAAIGGGGIAAFILAIGAALGGLGVILMKVDVARLLTDMKGSFGRLWEYLRNVASAAVAALIVAGINAAASLGRAYERVSASVKAAFQQLWEAVSTMVAGWGTSIADAAGRFRERAASTISAIIEWLVGIPGRILDSLSITPKARDSLLAPADPMDPAATGVPPAAGGASPSAFVPPPEDRSLTVRTALMLDGRVLTEAVNRYQGRALNSPVQSPSFYDRRRGMLGGEVVAT